MHENRGAILSRSFVPNQLVRIRKVKEAVLPGNNGEIEACISMISGRISARRIDSPACAFVEETQDVGGYFKSTHISSPISWNKQICSQLIAVVQEVGWWCTVASAL